MQKTITYILLGVLLTSCGYFGNKIDLFNNIDFTEEADWLLVKTNMDIDSCEVIYNKDILLKLHDDLVIKSSEECSGTTPDYCLGLYKNGMRISSTCYCSWILNSFKFGRLKNEFIPATRKHVTANTIKQHDYLLDSLQQIDYIHLLYPKDTIIEFPDLLKFDIKLIDKNQDIFEQEKPIEEEFKRIFKNGNYRVKADWYSSEVGTPRKLGYHILVDCDSSFLEHFENSELNKSDLFQEMTKYKYVKKDFKIYYYQWDE
jgi:hypothetical protein